MSVSDSKEYTKFDDLWDFSDPEETEKRFREILPKIKAGSSLYIELLTQIARTHSLRRQFDEAHTLLNEAQNLVTASQSRAKVRLLLERGRTYNSAGQQKEAKPLFLKAWEIAGSLGEDNLAIDAAHMMGIVEPPDRQLEWSLRALELTEQTTDERAKKWLGPLYNNIGWTYHDNDEFESALKYFEKSYQYRKSQGQVRETQIARWSVARALRSLQRVSEALTMHRDLLAELDEAGTRDGYVFEEIAECLLILDQKVDASPYFAQAYEELAKDPWLAEHEQDRLQRLRKYGMP